jgi:hypothetical protein
VDKLGLSLAQGTIQKRLASGVGQVLLTPNNVGYSHHGVVDDRGEVVGRGAVGLAHHEILDVGEVDLAAPRIPESTAACGRQEVQCRPSGLVLCFVDQSGFEEAPYGFFIELSTLALPVRPLVEGQAEPGQILELRTLKLPRAPRPISVLDAQDNLTVVVAGEEVVEERGAGTAEVQHPRGTWGEAYPNSVFSQRSSDLPGDRRPEPLSPRPGR